MNVATSSLFSQLLSLVDRNRFAKLVLDTESERRTKGFANAKRPAELFEKLFYLVLGDVRLHAPRQEDPLRLSAAKGG